ncbi:endonuclease/exonuclease/phosphatase family protein [Aridibaculum aurantiacum]|uniref:endonuclease/exonuclease/phosphatase family protein n=1 Tax=Aridibaculum aurantiacum TaxID=2810307 RepID=UPI001A95E394|nr:endonuclease/exonuclease/phosphatase family protein [Aridibaculum aurantiacum]
MRKFFYLLLVATTGLLAIVYFVSCLTPYISPVQLWPLAFLALGFPYLALAVLVYIILWLLVKKKVALYLLILLLLGFSNITSTIGFNIFSTEAPGREATLRVLAWNVRNFDNPANHADSANSVRRRMFRYIQQVNADVLLLQEMTEYVGPSFLSNNITLRQLGYKYYYKPKEIDNVHPYGTLQQGNAIFSKYPLIDTGSMVLNDPSYPQKILYADIQFEGKPVRLITTHFRSFHLFAKKKHDPPVPFHNDTGFINNSSNFQKLKVIQQDHAEQAAATRKYIEASPYPVVFAADMNSVPASYAYHKTRGNMRDAFLSKSWGLGGSMDSMPKTLRIDHILVNKEIDIMYYKQQRLSLSDHYPHFADLKWKR